MTLDELFNDLFAEHFRDHHAHKECGIWHRFAAINKQLGQKGRVVFVIETNCAQGFERWLHREYRERRVRTEFFRLTENDLRALRAMNQFNGGTLVFRRFNE